MQATTCLHDGIANPVLQKTSLGFHHTVAFYPANRGFDTDADGRDRTVGNFLRWGEFPTRGVFLGWENADPLASVPLEPPILIETPSGWEGIALQIGQAFVVYLPFIGGTQEAKMTGLLDDEEVGDRVALLLATLVCLLVLRIGWAVDRSLSTIMPKRGPEGPLAFVELRASPLNHQPYGWAGALGGRRPDSRRDGGDASTDSQAIGTCHRAALVLLE
jgi:hypothetical protein